MMSLMELISLLDFLLIFLFTIVSLVLTMWADCLLLEADEVENKGRERGEIDRKGKGDLEKVNILKKIHKYIKVLDVFLDRCLMSRREGGK